MHVTLDYHIFSFFIQKEEETLFSESLIIRYKLLGNQYSPCLSLKL